MASKKGQQAALLESDDLDGAVATVVDAGEKEKEAARSRLLVICFVAMLVVGCANRIFSVLQYTPMTNYPLFVNMLTTFAYLPTSLIYVLVMVYVMKKGWSFMDAGFAEGKPVAQWKWGVMGFLDSLAGVLQSIAIDKISNGTLVVLLLQAAIPFSMLITKVFLKTKYSASQYVGAGIVIAGIAVVLAPSMASGGDDGGVGWSVMLMASCIPMCLSSVFKEKALGDIELDPIWFNLMVAFYQFVLSFPLLPPSAIAAGVPIDQIWTNLWNGTRCYVGLNSIAGDACASSPLYVNLYILANLGYNILIILIIKYGSSNILWLSMTATVPISDLAFGIPGIPGYTPLTWSIWVGLPVIMAGLVTYRFYAKASAWARAKMGYKPVADEEDGEVA